MIKRRLRAAGDARLADAAARAPGPGLRAGRRRGHPAEGPPPPGPAHPHPSHPGNLFG